MKENLQDKLKRSWAFIKKNETGVVTLFVLLVLGLSLFLAVGSRSSQSKQGEKGYRYESQVDDIQMISQGDQLYGYAVKGSDYWVAEDNLVEATIQLKNYDSSSRAAFSLDSSDKFQLTFRRLKAIHQKTDGVRQVVEQDVLADFREMDSDLIPVEIDKEVYRSVNSLTGWADYYLKILAINKMTGGGSYWYYAIRSPGNIEKEGFRDGDSKGSDYTKPVSYQQPTTADLLPMLSKKYKSREIVDLLNYTNTSRVEDKETGKEKVVKTLQVLLEETPSLLDDLRLTEQFPQVTEMLKAGGSLYWLEDNRSGMTYLSELLAKTSQTSLFDQWTLPAASARNLQDQTLTSYDDYLSRSFDSSHFAIGIQDEFAIFMGQRREDYSPFYWNLRKGNLAIVDTPYQNSSGYESRWARYLFEASNSDIMMRPNDNERVENALTSLEESLAARQKGEQESASPVLSLVYSYSLKKNSESTDYWTEHIERIKKLAAEGPSHNIYFVFVTASKSSELDQSSAILELAKEQKQKLLASSFDDQVIAEGIQSQADSSLLNNHNFLFIDGETETLVYNPVLNPRYELQKESNQTVVRRSKTVNP